MSGKPISQLSPQTTLADTDLFIISNKNETNWQSKHVTYGSLHNNIRDAFGLGSGNPGDVVYMSNTGIIKQSLMNSDVLICEDETEVELCKTSQLTMKNIFESWQIGGAISDKYLSYDASYAQTKYNFYNNPNINDSTRSALKSGLITPTIADSYTGPNVNDYGYRYWIYNETMNTIVQVANSNDVTWFQSPMAYSDYDITFRAYSYDHDDDIIGFMAAIVEDASGRPHTLSICRTPNMSNTELNTETQSATDYHWYIEIDKCRLPAVKKDTIIDVETLSNLNDDLSANKGWKHFGEGVLIRVKRAGNTITAWTTPFALNKTLDVARDQSQLKGRITIDLTTSKFTQFANKPGKIGFMSLSQKCSMYDIRSAQIPSTIVDINASTVETYDVTNDQWNRIPGADPFEYVGIGRLSKNILTGKTFYVGQRSFSLIGTV